MAARRRDTLHLKSVWLNLVIDKTGRKDIEWTLKSTLLEGVCYDGKVVSLDVGLSISTATGSVPIGRVSKAIMIFVLSIISWYTTRIPPTAMQNYHFCVNNNTVRSKQTL